MDSPENRASADAERVIADQAREIDNLTSTLRAVEAATVPLVSAVRAFCLDGGCFGPMVRALVVFDEARGFDTFGRRALSGSSRHPAKETER